MNILNDLYKKYEEHPEFIGVKIQEINHPSVLDNTMLHLAASRGSLDDIKYLVNNGADINKGGDLKNTPLQIAVIMGKFEAVKLLLKLGASKHTKNEFGETPLDSAKLGDREDIVCLLK